MTGLAVAVSETASDLIEAGAVTLDHSHDVTAYAERDPPPRSLFEDS